MNELVVAASLSRHFITGTDTLEVLRGVNLEVRRGRDGGHHGRERLRQEHAPGPDRRAGHARPAGR